MANKEKQREYQKEFSKWYRLESVDDVENKILRIFDRKDCFAVYGQSQCEYIADEFYRTRQCIVRYGNLECIYIKQPILDSIINDYVNNLQATIYRYKFCGRGEWRICEKITPSNFSIDSLSEASFNLSCVIINYDFTSQELSLGVALINYSTYSFEICQFIEDSQFTKLISLFISKGIKQCLFYCKNENKSLKFIEILQKSNINLIDNKREDKKFWSSFIKNESLQIETINNILNKLSCKLLLNIGGDRNYKLSLIALCGIILHEELSKDENNWNRYKLKKHQIDSFMRLDHASLSALNLFPIKDKNKRNNNNNNNNNNNMNCSLYGILKKCKSNMGDRLLSIWIRQPLVNLAEIYRRQKLVKIFVENNEEREILRDEHLKLLIDLEKLCGKLEGVQKNNKTKLKDLVDLYYFAVTLPFIKETLLNVENVEFDGDGDGDKDKETPLDLLKNEFISPIQEMDDNFNNYLAMIEQVVDLPATAKRQYLIKHEFDHILDQIDKKKKKIWNEMEKCRDNIILSLKLNNDNNNKRRKKNNNDKPIIHKHKSYGYCLRASKTKHYKIISKQKKFYPIISTTKSHIFFTDNGNLKKLSKSYIEYEQRYIDRQKQIIDKTIEITKTYIPVINQAILIFGELDVILCLAHTANHSPSSYVLPKIVKSNNKIIEMKNARHPCLEFVKSDDGVIANDVSLINNKSSFQIITGPNMGGKSTYIRMIGLIVLMAQIGSYVPCDYCKLSIIDSILSRVGAGDNQLRGVSTFMSEMLETSSILQAATCHSLIIIDELGRGTSTYDGYGIAYAISKYIIQNLKSFTLFATHFHELSILQKIYPNYVKNKYVSVISDNDNDNDNQSLVMLYKIKNGVCPQSFGIEVAKLAKFPKKVIQIAKDKVNQLENASNSNSNSINKNTYNSIQKILKMYNDIIKNNNDNNDNNDNKKELIEKLKTQIEQEMNNNPQLDNIALKIQKMLNQNQNQNQSDKMELD